MRKTNKTTAVLRMLTGEKITNPILTPEFKEDVIRPIEELKKRIPESVVNTRTGNETEINITAELVSEWLPAVLERFGCCRCPRCYAEASVAAFDRIKPVKAKIRRPADLEKADKLKETNRRKVIMSLVSIAAERKGNPKHN